MTYFTQEEIALTIAAVWACSVAYVLADGWGRKMPSLLLGLWTIFAIGTGPIAVPVYRAARPLKSGETRPNGFLYNALRDVAHLWSLLAVGLWGLAMLQPATIWVRIGATGIMLFAWLLPAAPVWLLAGAFKRDGATEGPTGSLIGRDRDSTSRQGSSAGRSSKSGDSSSASSNESMFSVMPD